jgi:hypothetical protein
MPPGYGYLTRHLPQKVTHARISDPATEQVLTLGSKTTFVLFSTISMAESYEWVGEHVSGKADRAEGLLRLLDTDTSLVTFREK